jgi:hypothetical protein
MSPLSPWNPLDHARLLWWVLVAPQQLKAYRDGFGAGDEWRVGRWLVSALIWWPLFIPTLALAFDVMPRGVDAFSAGFYRGGLLSLLLAWAVTGWLGNVDIAERGAGVAGIGTRGVLALGMALAWICGVAVGVPIGIADALARDQAFAVTASICIAEGVAFVVAHAAASGVDRGILGNLVGFAAFGVAGFVAIGAGKGLADFVLNLVVVGVTIRTMLRVEEGIQASLKIGYPFWTARVTFVTLVLVYTFLIWFSLAGGWRVFQ